MDLRAHSLAALGPILALAVTASSAPAVDLETLVMPGPVIEAHADVESECSRCHQPFEGGSENGLCLACHEEIAADLKSLRGFHGLHPTVGAVDCRTCHTEHKGRDADVTGLDPAAFDHSLTDFALGGAHVRLACARCHEPDGAHRDAPSTCIGCHREDDAHGGELGEDCADCHGDDTWSEGVFDHSETGFPLEYAHRTVACGLCHPGGQYEGTPSDCVSCHGVDDAHGGQFGRRCGTCHTARAWETVTFDHGTETRFALDGRHAEAKCVACHTGTLGEEELSTDCLSCHRLDDDHRGRNGTDCGRCHDSRSWKRTAFDHDRDTGYPLRGAHRQVSCEACHRGNVFEEELDGSCFSCHRGDDAHDGDQGRRCERCHRETSWTADVAFDHDVTAFPLLGLHALVACEACHASHRFRDAADECADCHRDDDVHTERLGDRCVTCHNPNGWRIWRFDHDARTDFALHGAHEGLDCHSCHRAPVSGEIRLSQRCYGCHARDDAHSGFLGRDCSRCHGDVSWEDAEVQRR